MGTLGLLGKMAIGGGIMAAGTAIYNEATGDNKSIGSSLFYGALAGAAIIRPKATLSALENLSKKSILTRAIDNSASMKSHLLDKILNAGEKSFFKFDNPDIAYERIINSLKGAAVGGTFGAAYGLASPDDSMFSGAMKGAILGGLTHGFFGKTIGGEKGLMFSDAEKIWGSSKEERFINNLKKVKNMFGVKAANNAKKSAQAVQNIATATSPLNVSTRTVGTLLDPTTPRTKDGIILGLAAKKSPTNNIQGASSLLKKGAVSKAKKSKQQKKVINNAKLINKKSKKRTKKKKKR